MTDQQTQVTEVVQPTTMEVIAKAELDTQIVTAKRFPRDLQKFFHTAETLATQSPEIAAQMAYAKPVGGGQTAEGPSVRLAEIVMASYGNIRAQAMVISIGQTEIVVRGMAHDLENNTAASVDVVKSIIKRDGKRYGPEQVSVMCAAACSIARRNAIFEVVPRALVAGIIEKARKVAAGTEKDLPTRRKALLEWLCKHGLTRQQIYQWMEVSGEDAVTLDHMAKLHGLIQSCKEDGTSFADAIKDASQQRSSADSIAAKPQEKTAETVEKEGVKQ